jgi:2,4-diketo-3-deoxy-L-fuconate hydrolase
VKLMRVGPPGAESPAVLLSGDRYLDVSNVVVDFDEAFFGSGEAKRLRDVVAARQGTRGRPLGGARIGAPIARPHQIICVGLNYADYAEETGQPTPSEPILFNKAPNTLVGPRDDVVLPLGATRTDWEVELGIVIGSRASYLADPEDARRHVAGWTVVNGLTNLRSSEDRA